MGHEQPIVLREEQTRGRYVYQETGAPEAELTFSKAGTKMIIIDHTDVPGHYRGQGVGAKLVSRAVDDAREWGKKIIPLCPFAAAQFGKHPEWADVRSG